MHFIAITLKHTLVICAYAFDLDLQYDYILMILFSLSKKLLWLKTYIGNSTICLTRLIL